MPENELCVECEYFGSCLHEDAHTNAKICPARRNELKLKKEVERLQHNMNQAEGHIENKQVEIEALNKEISRLNITESEIEAEEELEADEFNQLIAERDHLKKHITSLKIEIEDNRERYQKIIRMLRQEIEVLERQRDRAIENHKDAHFEMHLEREYRKADEKKMNEYKARAIQLENENRTLAFELKKEKEALEGLKAAVNMNAKTAFKESAENENLNEQTTELKEQLNEAWEEIRFLRKQVDSLKTDGICLNCVETDAANNELRNKIIPKLTEENKKLLRQVAVAKEGGQLCLDKADDLIDALYDERNTLQAELDEVLAARNFRTTLLLDAEKERDRYKKVLEKIKSIQEDPPNRRRMSDDQRYMYCYGLLLRTKRDAIQALERAPQHTKPVTEDEKNSLQKENNEMRNSLVYISDIVEIIKSKLAEIKKVTGD